MIQRLDIPSDQVWLELVHLKCCARFHLMSSATVFFVRMKFDLNMLVSVFWQLFGYVAKRFVWPWKKKLHHEFVWNFMLPIESRLGNCWKYCRYILRSLLYDDHKFLSGTKHLVKITKSSKISLMLIVHPPLLMTIT